MGTGACGCGCEVRGEWGGKERVGVGVNGGTGACGRGCEWRDRGVWAWV